MTMLGFTLLLTLATTEPVDIQTDNQEPNILQATWKSPDDPQTEVMLVHRLDKINPRKINPVTNETYSFSTSGHASRSGTNDFQLRFRVFAQSRKPTINDEAQWATRLLLRLWGYIYNRLQFDHAELYRRLVDVYLSNEGKPGGYTKRTKDFQDRKEGSQPPPVNVITIHEVDSISHPFQLVREICHEYGHAVISDYGPFDAKESWVNGDIGEKLFINWLYQDIKAKRLTTDDVAQCDLETLEAYVEQRVDPLIKKMGANGPNTSIQNSSGQAGYDEVIALSVYAQTILPPKLLGRALRYPVKNPSDFSKAIVDVATTHKNWVIDVPNTLEGTDFYLPIGSAKITGAKILSKKGDWVKIRPTGKQIGINNE